MRRYGPGESKQPHRHLAPRPAESKIPVYVDGKLKVTLRGETIVPEFLRILDDYVEKTYGERATVAIP